MSKRRPPDWAGRLEETLSNSPQTDEVAVLEPSSGTVSSAVCGTENQNEHELYQELGEITMDYSIDSCRNPLVQETIASVSFNALNSNCVDRDNDVDFASVDSKIDFWKYHILKFGKDLYLSTNPQLQHVYCRNGPGYFVQIDKSNADRCIYRFKNVESIEYNLSDLTIERLGSDKFAIHNVGEIKRVEASHTTYNFELTVNGKTYNLGSLPRVRKRKFGGLRKKMSALSQETDTGLAADLKYIGKQCIYFYNKQEYDDSGLDIDIEANLGSGRYVRSGICGFFRPQANTIKKKIIREFKHIYQTHKEYGQRDTQDDISNLLVGTATKKFVTANDGLYQGGNTPKDDMPDEDKLGWISIYNYENVKDMENSDYFLIILASTLVIGLEEKS